MDEAWAMVADWTHAEIAALNRAVPEKALAASFRGRPLADWCDRMLAIAEAGLVRIGQTNDAGQSEAIFLAPLKQTLASRQTQAERWLAAWEGEWRREIDRIFLEAIHP